MPRALLAPPRLVFQGLTQLLLLGTAAEEEYQIRYHAEDIFFNDKRTFGIFPTAFYETGFGANVGVRLLHRDLFGEGENLQLRAGYGGRSRQVYAASIDTGARSRVVRQSLGLRYERDDRGRFYGIGNEDRVEPEAAELPLNALQSSPGIATLYRREIASATTVTRIELGRGLELDAGHEWRIRRLSSGTPGARGNPWVDEVFAPETLVGFESPLVDAYTQIALRWDGRRALRADVPRDLPASGWMAGAWAGLQTGVTEPQATFPRAGFDLHPFVDLLRGDRVLHLRLRGDAIFAPLREIPFADLLTLGGADTLRGYNGGRFRGRVSLLASVEYRYPVQEAIAAYLFTDSGRVWTGFDELSLSSLGEVRLGFGAGLQFFAHQGALFRVQVASSIDGGFFLNLRFNTTGEFDLGR